MPLEPFFADLLSRFTEPEVLPWLDPAFAAPVNPYVPPAVDLRAMQVPGPAGAIHVRVYSPTAIAEAPRSCLLWFHGGAFIGGGLDMPEADGVSRELAHRADCVVVSVDYRLCTEDIRFPAPQEDGFAVLQWVSAHAGEIAVDPTRISVGGASAGACLAASLCVMDRDSGNPVVNGALLIYPVAHATPQPTSAELVARLEELPAFLQFDDEFQRRHNLFLLGGSLTDANRYCYAGELDDLSGLPPTLILNCEYDSLLASGSRYAHQLRAAGVTVTERLESGVIHGHLNRTPADCRGTEASLRFMTEFLTARAQ